MSPGAISTKQRQYRWSSAVCSCRDETFRKGWCEKKTAASSPASPHSLGDFATPAPRSLAASSAYWCTPCTPEAGTWIKQLLDRFGLSRFYLYSMHLRLRLSHEKIRGFGLGLMIWIQVFRTRPDLVMTYLIFILTKVNSNLTLMGFRP